MPVAGRAFKPLRGSGGGARTEAEPGISVGCGAEPPRVVGDGGEAGFGAGELPGGVGDGEVKLEERAARSGAGRRSRRRSAARRRESRAPNLSSSASSAASRSAAGSSASSALDASTFCSARRKAARARDQRRRSRVRHHPSPQALPHHVRLSLSKPSAYPSVRRRREGPSRRIDGPGRRHRRTERSTMRPRPPRTHRLPTPRHARRDRV
jgi:hypothetical protein